MIHHSHPTSRNPCEGRAKAYGINRPSPIGGRCHEVTDEGCGHLAAVTRVVTFQLNSECLVSSLRCGPHPPFGHLLPTGEGQGLFVGDCSAFAGMTELGGLRCV